MNTVTIEPAYTPETCTECRRGIPKGEPAVYVNGYGKGSRRFEFVLCVECSAMMREEITDALEEGSEE